MDTQYQEIIFSHTYYGIKIRGKSIEMFSIIDIEN
jgi:hypothetical protein